MILSATGMTPISIWLGEGLAFWADHELTSLLAVWLVLRQFIDGAIEFPKCKTMADQRIRWANLGVGQRN